MMGEAGVVVELDAEGEVVRADSSGEVVGADGGKSKVRPGENCQLRVGAERSGMRLDAVLGELFPGMGLRGRRRLVGRGAVLVNGRRAKSGQAVRTGDLVEAVGEQASRSAQTGQPVGVPQARLLDVKDGFCFFARDRVPASSANLASQG